jgi:hypothetical protein
METVTYILHRVAIKHNHTKKQHRPSKHLGHDNKKPPKYDTKREQQSKRVTLEKSNCQDHLASNNPQPLS